MMEKKETLVQYEDLHAEDRSLMFNAQARQSRSGRRCSQPCVHAFPSVAII